MKTSLLLFTYANINSYWVSSLSTSFFGFWDLRLAYRIRYWEFGLKIGIEDWGWRLGLRIEIEDWEFRLGIRDYSGLEIMIWGLGLGF